MKTINTFLILLISSFILISCGPSNGKKESQAKVQQKLDELIKDNDLPGIHFSVVYANGEHENYSSGFANKETNTKMFNEHLMFSGSIGKTYAVAVLMQLVDEGKVDLDEKFITYFPNHEWLGRLANINDFTVRNLVEHTTGLPRWVFDPDVWARALANPDMVWSYKDRLEYVFDEEAVHETGKQWHYSDTNYLLIGMLIEHITQNGLYDEVRERVLTPYSLKFTYPSLRRIIPNLAQGYSQLTDWHIPPKVIADGKFVFNPQMEWTGGGFYSTTDDLAKWAQIYFTSDVFSEDLRTQIITPTKAGTKIDSNLSYGMGSFIYHTKHGNMYGHTGTFPGYKSVFAYYPKEKMALAVQINCDYADKERSTTSYLVEIMDVLLNK